MTAKEYLETKTRMTDGCYVPDVCNLSCPLSGKRNKYHVECSVLENEYPDEAIAIVQKWGEEHPVKTLMDKFFEVFPDTPKTQEGHPFCCPWEIGLKSELHDVKVNPTRDCGNINCLQCWSQPYREPKE